MRAPALIEARPEHAVAIARVMRAEDRAEAWALARATPLEAVQSSLRHSTRAWSWFDGPEALMMCGVGSDVIVGGVGRPWMVSGTGVATRRVAYTRASLNALERMLSLYPRLENWVDARYVVCLRWLRWLGFTVHEPVAMGALGLPFHRFEIGVP